MGKSIFNNEIIIEAKDIEQLYNYNDITVSYCFDELKVDMGKGNDTITMIFNIDDIGVMFNDDIGFEHGVMVAIAEKINELKDTRYEEIATAIADMNNSTKKLIAVYQNEAYENYLFSNDDFLYKSKNDFLNNEYCDSEILKSLIGEEKAGFLSEHDPILNTVDCIEKVNQTIQKKIIKEAVEQICEYYDSQNYGEISGKVISEITGLNPEIAFEKIESEGTEFLYDRIDRLSETSTENILSFIEQIEFPAIEEEIEYTKADELKSSIGESEHSTEHDTSIGEAEYSEEENLESFEYYDDD